MALLLPSLETCGRAIYSCCIHIQYIINLKTMENQEHNDGQLKIELTPEVAEGIYANLAIITHSSAEVTAAFAHCPTPMRGAEAAPHQSP